MHNFNPVPTNYFSLPAVPNTIVSRKATPSQLLTPPPTNYTPAPTTSCTKPVEVTPPLKQFIPFTVPVPETRESPITELIYPGSPTYMLQLILLVFYD